MSKLFLRAIGFLLLPCLVAEPALPAPATWLPAHLAASQSLYATQALTPSPISASRYSMKLRIGVTLVAAMVIGLLSSAGIGQAQVAARTTPSARAQAAPGTLSPSARKTLLEAAQKLSHYRIARMQIFYKYMDDLPRGQVNRFVSLRIAEGINALHEAPDSKRFESIEGASVQDLYQLMVEAEEEMYTSTYNGLFNRFLAGLRDDNLSGDQFLDRVHQDGIRTFVKLAARYNRLNEFLNMFTPAQRRALLIGMVKGLEEGEGLVDAMSAADIVSSVRDPGVSNLLRDALKSEYQKMQAGKNQRGQVIYGLLLSIDFKNHHASDTWLEKVVAAYPVAGPVGLSHSTLFGPNGIHVQQYYFYDDNDGRNSYASFLAAYRNDPLWSVEDHGTYLVIHSQKTSNRAIEIYANKPGHDEAVQTIRKYLEAHKMRVHAVVHRGHSFHADGTIQNITADAMIVYLGSCGGFANVEKVLNLSPNANIVSTKGVGRMGINDPLLKMINQEILARGTLNWSTFWANAERRIHSPDFSNYISPTNNLGAAFLMSFTQKMKTLSQTSKPTASEQQIHQLEGLLQGTRDATHRRALQGQLAQAWREWAGQQREDEKRRRQNLIMEPQPQSNAGQPGVQNLQAGLSGIAGRTNMGTPLAQIVSSYPTPVAERVCNAFNAVWGALIFVVGGMFDWGKKNRGDPGTPSKDEPIGDTPKMNFSLVYPTEGPKASGLVRGTERATPEGAVAEIQKQIGLMSPQGVKQFTFMAPAHIPLGPTEQQQVLAIARQYGVYVVLVQFEFGMGPGYTEFAFNLENQMTPLGELELLHPETNPHLSARIVATNLPASAFDPHQDPDWLAAKAILAPGFLKRLNVVGVGAVVVAYPHLVNLMIDVINETGALGNPRTLEPLQHLLSVVKAAQIQVAPKNNSVENLKRLDKSLERAIVRLGTESPSGGAHEGFFMLPLRFASKTVGVIFVASLFAKAVHMTYGGGLILTLAATIVALAAEQGWLSVHLRRFSMDRQQLLILRQYAMAA